jgi:hypothetical protein
MSSDGRTSTTGPIHNGGERLATVQTHNIELQLAQVSFQAVRVTAFRTRAPSSPHARRRLSSE